MISSLAKLVCVAFAIAFCAQGVLAELDDSLDMIYTEEEVEALAQFREMVKESITEDFMTSDFYLIRWIRTNRMNLENAKYYLEKNINWRKDNNISNILDEDWTDMLEEFFFEFSGTDRKGRPIGTIDLGDWDLRAASVTGRSPRVMRYLWYTLERGMQILLHSIKENGSTNITRGVVLVDAANLGMRTHLCASCLGMLGSWVSTMDSYYPSFLKEVIIINAPYIIKIAHNALWPIMSSESRGMIRSFNYNPNSWGPYLDERIDKNQRSPRYGGTREAEIAAPGEAAINSTNIEAVFESSSNETSSFELF